MNYKIQSNPSGTRCIEVSDEHLASIQKYALFENLVDSTGIIDEDILNKLKLNVRSLLESEANHDKALLDLCLDVIYHANMEAFGLNQLVKLYVGWTNKQTEGKVSVTSRED